MSENKQSRLLVMIALVAFVSLVSLSHGLLVVAPNHIRSNQKYTVVISNFESSAKATHLKLRIEGHAVDGTVTLNVTKESEVPQNTNGMIHFSLPANLAPGSYKLTVDRQRGLRFHRETDLTLLSRSLAGLIQISKPVFKPGDTVQFRAIVLDTDLKPPVGLASVYVIVQDPHGNVIRKWSSARLHSGVFDNELQIAPSPILGTYSITVQSKGEELASKRFVVKEYVLSTYDVNVYPSVVPLEEHRGLNLTISAQYNVGVPVEGTATVDVYLEDDVLDQRKMLKLIGSGHLVVQFNNELEIYDDSQSVRLNVTFTEKHTNRTVSKEHYITVYKHKYRVELLRDTPTFRPGALYGCSVKVAFQDGRPAQGVSVQVAVDGLPAVFKNSYKTDDSGLTKVAFNTAKSMDELYITVSINEKDLLGEVIDAAEHDTGAFLKVHLESTPKANTPVSLRVTCTNKMSFFVYYIIAKGDLIHSGFVQLGNVTTHLLHLKPSEKMMPKAKIVVATTSNNIVVYDFVDLGFAEFQNNFDLKIGKNQVKPGETLKLTMTGRPGSYVALAAYDKSLLQFSKDHDLYWDDAMKAFDGLHAIEENISDPFGSFGLIALLREGISFDNVNTGRAGLLSRRVSRSKSVSFRTNFLESFLWTNLTISQSGSSTLEEVVPESTTSWRLTGFSIDPVYGLAIVRKPIEFKTLQPFYIVDNLPYSMKRGEAVLLQFTLFSNLPGKAMAKVTMHSVDNQMEYIGRSVNDSSHTKTVTVPPNVGVPVSFLVKARTIGEMVVRLSASIDRGSQSETDGIEKAIRVLPESLVQRKSSSLFFSHDTYRNQSFAMVLDIDKNADRGSQKIEFTLVPNILTTVLKNLDNLLSVPSGCGEQNMIRFVPNILVLDYLTAIGSKEKHLMSKAKGLLKLGYQNQMKYRLSDGSFGLWANSAGSVFLTAFVGNSMQIASKYIPDVDAAMVLKAFDWLAQKQHSSGRFDAAGAVYHKDMQGGLRNGVALTSYVLIAFLENKDAAEKHLKVVEKAVRFITGNLPAMNDAYDLSLATYALWLNSHYQKHEALAKLMDLSTTSKNETERHWHRSSNQVETTAYALLSLVLAERYVDGTAVMRWLVNQRYETGSFPRTQDTFVGLKALTKLAEKIAPARNDYSIQLIYPQRRKEFRVTSLNIEQMSYDEFTENTNKLEFNVAGFGFGLLQVSYQYALELSQFRQQFNLDVVRRNSTLDSKLELYVCSSFIPNLVDERSNMALVEVFFPSGYVVDDKPISEKTTAYRISNIEIRFGGTSVVLYYDNMGTEKNCFLVTAYRRVQVAFKRPAHVIVHDYYDPQLTAVRTYEVDSQDVCEICDPADCPDSCSAHG